jgi:uncharacterized protein YxjI
VLSNTKFVVKEQPKTFSTMLYYEIADDKGEVLGSGEQKASWLATILSMVIGKDSMPLSVEIRQNSDAKPLFTVRRSGYLFPKVEVLDENGEVVASYKAKSFSFSGGYDVYDKDGNHLAEMQGNIFKADYKFVSPDGSVMGNVSKSWGSLAKELFTGAGTYGVQIDPVYLDKSGGLNPKTILMILGGALAVDACFKKRDKAGVAAGSSDDGESSSSSSSEE